MTHKHYCVGKCGEYLRCNARVIRDDCGAHCEAEEDRDPYECDECYEARREAEDEADQIAEHGEAV